MKKCWCILLLLAILFLFAGCQTVSTGTPGTDAPGNTETASQTAATQAVTVVEIVDLTENGELFTDDVLERFYSDGEYDYYFASAKSHYVLVRYSDGTEKAVKEALEAGDITIADLDKFEIDYGKQEKTK